MKIKVLKMNVSIYQVQKKISRFFFAIDAKRQIKIYFLTELYTYQSSLYVRNMNSFQFKEEERTF